MKPTLPPRRAFGNSIALLAALWFVQPCVRAEGPASLPALATRAANPAESLSAIETGDAAWLEGHLEAALAHYERARNADPTRPGIHSRIARLSLELSSPTRGLAACDTWSSLRPEVAEDPEFILLRRRLERLESTSDRSPKTTPDLVPVRATRRPADPSGLDRHAAAQALAEALAATRTHDWGEARALARESLRHLLPVLRENRPGEREVWVQAALIADLLAEPRLGAAALDRLQPGEASALPNHSDPETTEVVAALHRRSEVRNLLPEVGRNRPVFLAKLGRCVNSLGMEFVALPGSDVYFGIWETRVRDFAAFVNESHHKAERGTWSIDSDGWKRRNHSWRDPGFQQTPDHPVCGVDWVDAMAFCDWLTRRERGLGWIASTEEYRLPTDSEWSAAVGTSRFPWGDSWPPPADAGNYFGTDSVFGREPGAWATDLAPDQFPRTAPVGSFTANALGIHDLGGNVWEWCMDWYRRDLNPSATRQEFPSLEDDAGGSKYRVLRGASWTGGDPVSLRSDYRRSATPDSRYIHRGFRCVLVGKKPGTSPSLARLTSSNPARLQVARVPDQGGPDSPPSPADTAPPP